MRKGSEPGRSLGNGKTGKMGGKGKWKNTVRRRVLSTEEGVFNAMFLALAGHVFVVIVVAAIFKSIGKQNNKSANTNRKLSVCMLVWVCGVCVCLAV